MKRLLTFAIIILAAVTLSAQGSFLTRTLKVHIEDLEQPTYAFLSFADSAITQALTQDTWSVIDDWVVQDSSETTASSDTVTIRESGDYIIQASLSYLAGTGDTIYVAILNDGTQIGAESTTNSADPEVVFIQAHAALSEGDYITVAMMNDTDGTDATVYSGSLFVRRFYY